MKYFYNPKERAETIINYVRERGQTPSLMVANALEFTLPYDFKRWLLKPIASKRSFWSSYIDDLRKSGYAIVEYNRYMKIRKTIGTTTFEFNFYPEVVYLYVNDVKSPYHWNTGTDRPYSKPVYTKPTLMLFLKEFEKYVMKVRSLVEKGYLEGLKDQKLKDLENKIKNLKEN